MKPTTTLLVDFNSLHDGRVTVFLEPSAYLEGSPAMPPAPGDYVLLRGEEGMRCYALVHTVENSVATLKIDEASWGTDVQAPALGELSRTWTPASATSYVA